MWLEPSEQGVIGSTRGTKTLLFLKPCCGQRLVGSSGFYGSHFLSRSKKMTLFIFWDVENPGMENLTNGQNVSQMDLWGVIL